MFGFHWNYMITDEMEIKRMLKIQINIQKKISLHC